MATEAAFLEGSVPRERLVLCDHPVPAFEEEDEASETTELALPPTRYGTGGGERMSKSSLG